MRDANLFFDEALALTATQNSTNIIPLGPLASGNARRDIGAPGGMQLYLVLTVGDALVSSGSATLAVSVTTDDASGFGSATTIWSTPAIPKASLTAASKHVFPFPPGAYEDFLRLTHTVGTADFSGGTLYAEISMGLGETSYYAYDSALSNA